MHRRTLLALAPLLMAVSSRAEALPRRINHKAGVALDGHDTVAWFTEGRPRRGNPAFRADHAGVAWHFASADHLARFQAAPAAYTPRFGGFCAFGVARGYKVDIDPEAWHIRQGVLYLNYDLGVQRQWLRDVTSFIARAEANWPRLADA
ncbi:YHS domain-containing (seleno)protein [Roseomonas sp. F4]